MADCLKHFADLLRASLAEPHFEPAIAFIVAASSGLDACDVTRQRALPFDRNASAQLVE